MMLLQPFIRIYTLLKASGFLLKLVSNYAILKQSLDIFSQTIKSMQDDKRSIPNQAESIVLLQAVSNILKTGVIDLDGFDEYELSLDLDKYSSSIMLSIEDKKNKKYHEIALVKKEK